MISLSDLLDYLPLAIDLVRVYISKRAITAGRFRGGVGKAETNLYEGNTMAGVHYLRRQKRL